MDDVAEEEPDPEMDEHQVRGLPPVRFVSLASHGSVTLPVVKPHPLNGPM
jgi:hypothetical protein